MKNILLFALTITVSVSATSQTIPDWTKTSSTGNTVNLHDTLADNNAVVLFFLDAGLTACENAAVGMETIWQDYGAGACNVYMFGLDVIDSQTDADINNFLTTTNSTYNAFKECYSDYLYYDNFITGSGVPLIVVLNPDTANPDSSEIIHTQRGYASWVIQDIENALLSKGFNPCVTNVKSSINQPNNMTLHPNPTTGKFRVESLELGVKEVEVYDLLGQEVTGVRRKVSAGAIEIDLTSYPAGIYLVKLVLSGAEGVGEHTEKLILSK